MIINTLSIIDIGIQGWGQLLEKCTYSSGGHAAVRCGCCVCVCGGVFGDVLGEKSMGGCVYGQDMGWMVLMVLSEDTPPQHIWCKVIPFCEEILDQRFSNGSTLIKTQPTNPSSCLALVSFKTQKNGQNDHNKKRETKKKKKKKEL